MRSLKIFVQCVRGKPAGIVSDRGSAFTSAEFSRFLETMKVKIRRVAVASPWANGIVKRVNRYLKSSLTKAVESAGEIV